MWLLVHLQGHADALLLGGAAEHEAERQRRVARDFDVDVVVRHQRRQQISHLASTPIKISVLRCQVPQIYINVQKPVGATSMQWPASENAGSRPPGGCWRRQGPGP